MGIENNRGESVEKESQMQDISRLAKEILEIGKTRLLLNLRFLNQALWQLKEKEDKELYFATDGEYFYYSSYQVIKMYRENQNCAIRMWLHPLMHCIFLHMFVNQNLVQEIWNLSCDMAAEAMICDLGFYQMEDSCDRMRKELFEKLKKKIHPFTAEKIYRFLLDEISEPGLIEAWQQLVGFDVHKLWYMKKSQTGFSSQKSSTKEDGKLDRGEETEGGPGEAPDARSKLWKHISERMESELQTFSREQGEKSGDFRKALTDLHRKKCDYREFLRKFATRSEVMKVSSDEFDYIFYSYGLELYKDMPLIEPLEYSEDKKIRDFVIVIDTSGSVQGEMVRLFLEKTFTILKQQETFDRQFRLHIIQCDSAVKRDDVITTQQEFDAYMEKIVLRGFGGTDFRPAFDYVEQLKRNGDFKRLKGLLYFTDGLGKYPEKCPEYLTAFVFVNRESTYYAKVPAWAIQILLEKEDLQIIQDRSEK